MSLLKFLYFECWVVIFVHYANLYRFLVNYLRVWFLYALSVPSVSSLLVIMFYLIKLGKMRIVVGFLCSFE